MTNALGMVILRESVCSRSMTQNAGEAQRATCQLPECSLFSMGRTQGLAGRSTLSTNLWQLGLAARQIAPSRMPALLQRLPLGSLFLKVLKSACSSLGSQDPESRQQPTAQLTPAPDPFDPANLTTF